MSEVLAYAGPTYGGKEEADRIAELERRGWPASLIKATTDSFEYACYVRHLGVVKFRSAESTGDGAFVRLVHWVNDNRSELAGVFPYHCPRGLEVRVADLVWCADAPEGS